MPNGARPLVAAQGHACVGRCSPPVPDRRRIYLLFMPIRRPALFGTLVARESVSVAARRDAWSPQTPRSPTRTSSWSSPAGAMSLTPPVRRGSAASPAAATLVPPMSTRRNCNTVGRRKRRPTQMLCLQVIRSYFMMATSTPQRWDVPDAAGDPTSMATPGASAFQMQQVRINQPLLGEGEAARSWMS